MDKEEFLQKLTELNIKYDDEILAKLDEFYNLLIEWNEKINLTTIIEKKEVYLKHFYDSLTLTKVVNLNGNIKLCDVGSGAGFPGIVLKIFFKDLDIVLVDSLQKRINYLNNVIEKLNLKKIKAVHSRMEDYSLSHEEEFDIVTARAVANMSTLLEISVKSLKINGNLILMKANCQEEIVNSTKALQELNCKIIKIEKFILPTEKSNRTLIVINKENKTPRKYPRKMDKIKKDPL